MAYPIEIIAQLTSQFNIDANQQTALEETLRVPGIQQMVENHFLEPLCLIEQHDSDNNIKAILKATSAANIVSAFTERSDEKKEFLNQWIKLLLNVDILKQVPLKNLHQRRSLAEYITLQLVLPAATQLIQYPMLLGEWSVVSTQLSQYSNKLTQPIEEAATRYFSDLFFRNEKIIDQIKFYNKKAGIQLGVIMHITYHDTLGVHRAVFHIKTHQYGSTIAKSSVDSIDPKELYIYRVLEYTGNGPKAHFFFNPLSQGGFFIATQDLSFSKDPKKNKQFTLFEKVVGEFTTVHESPDIQHEKARLALVRLDILSRILRIHDVTTNPGNFGFVTIDEIREKWKILDFRTPDKETSDTYNNPNIFDGFNKGNGVFNYDYADFLRDIFSNPAQMPRKFDMAYEVVKELELGKVSQTRPGVHKMPLLSAMDHVLAEITAYTKENSTVMPLDTKTALDDLTQYHVALRHNYWTLTTGIQNKYHQLHGNAITLV